MTNDVMMTPIKGHLMRFATEGKINYFVMSDKITDPETGRGIGFYMIPQ